jgi:hypothetical protein
MIFALNILVRFITEFTPEGSPTPTRELSKIAVRYLKTTFPMEFITIIPFQLLNLGGYERLFYLIKILRVFIGFKIFNVTKIMHNLKRVLDERIKK